MREHLFIVRFKVSKTFLGKIITSVGCLHSFQGLFYVIVLTSYFGSTFYCHGKRGGWENNFKSLGTFVEFAIPSN